jgi:hypothetical protein
VRGSDLLDGTLGLESNREVLMLDKIIAGAETIGMRSTRVCMPTVYHRKQLFSKYKFYKFFTLFEPLYQVPHCRSPGHSPPNPNPSPDNQEGIISIYAPMIYTAPCIMFWMRAFALRGEVGGGFLGPKWHSPIGLMPFHRAQKTLEFQGLTPSHFPK